jgi:enoyl-CoA hydratase
MLDLEERGEITIVRLAHGKVNALDVELLRAIEKTFSSLDSRKAVVLTGAGRSLSAGVDLKRVAEGGPDYVRVFRPALSAAVKSVFYHPGPVVAAINGHAIAGGCVLAAACDIRLRSGGTIGLSELRVGVPFPGVPLEVMLDEAVAEAERLARIPPEVYAFTKRQLQGPARERIDALTPADDDSSTQMWASPVVQEAIAGFMSNLRQR